MMIKDSLVKWYLTRLFERLTKDVAKKNSSKTSPVDSMYDQGAAARCRHALPCQVPLVTGI